MNIKQLFFATMCFLSFNLDAQDVHFSYYQFSPSTISPALTGAYYGNIRATVLTRGQWTNVRAAEENSNDGFTTTSILIDGNIPFGFVEGDWVSAGITLLKEGNTAGILDSKRSFSGLSVAYHHKMGKKNPAVFTLGIKYGKYGYGFTQNGDAQSPWTIINANSISNDDDYRNMIQGAQDGIVKDEVNDFHLAFMYTTPIGKSDDMRFGVSSDHLLAPRLNVNQPMIMPPPDPPLPIVQGPKVERRINAFIQYYTDLSSKVMFNPSIVYQKMGAASNILLQGLFSYKHNEKKDITVVFGLGARLASNVDVPIYLGAEFKDWKVGLSFDTNVSGLTQATSNAGAYELGISKIFSWNKKAVVKPILICPRL